MKIYFFLQIKIKMEAVFAKKSVTTEYFTL